MGTVTDMAAFRRKRDEAKAPPPAKKSDDAVVVRRMQANDALESLLTTIGGQIRQVENHDLDGVKYARLLAAENEGVAEYRRLIPPVENPHSRMSANVQIALSKVDHDACNRVLHNLTQLSQSIATIIAYGEKIRAIREDLNRLRNTFRARRLSIVDREAADECMYTAVDYAARPAFYIEHAHTMLAEAKIAMQELHWSEAQRFLHEAEQVPAYLKQVEPAIQGGWLAEV